MNTPGQIIKTELTMTAQASLDEEIAAELAVPDPDKESAQAALSKGDTHEDSDKDQPAGKAENNK